ncbi:MAG: CehA/McbA family metallohydrolase [Verrucomicrobia bacterium]|nr:CehA/McbA family metallohydrolase [Verrucomicrobiota bacterium]
MIARIVFAVLCFGIFFNTASAEAPRTIAISDKEYHLGVAGLPEWQHFADSTPHGRELELRFDAAVNSHEQTLFIRHKDVKAPWEIRINNKRVGQLYSMDADMVEAFAVPANMLLDGENIFSLHAPKAHDDILVSDIRLEARPVTETLSQATLEISVTETGVGPSPCRITIADEQDALFQFHVFPEQTLATRVGVIYVRDGKARIGVPPGKYNLYAGRGFEYSVSTQKVVVATGEVRPVKMEIRREVPTPGLVACDTHIHNVTFSGHGDASIDEGMLTIAGEGIELAVATDHNHHTSYIEPAARMRVTEFFTPVTGNEVTTKAGHFNAFPVRADATLPDHTLTNWTALMQNIRSSTGAKVIQLNHPRSLHSNFIPLGEENLNPATGEVRRNDKITFDAIEVINSSAMRSDVMDIYPRWFALLNNGYRITGLGASDTHNVSRKILGQGRSYVVCDDTDPAKVDVDQICKSFLEGRVYVSQGLLTRMTVNDKFTVGDLATSLGRNIQVTVTVQGPSWTDADTVQLYANGIKIKEEKVSPSGGKVEKANITWTIPRPKHDVHLVAVATGPGITAPFWALSRSSQPTSKELNPRIIGSTNPIWVDADGDGKFTAARHYARDLVEMHGSVPSKLIPALGSYDEAIATQAASFYSNNGKDSRDESLAIHLQKAPAHVQRGFAEYNATLPAQKITGGTN